MVEINIKAYSDSPGCLYGGSSEPEHSQMDPSLNFQAKSLEMKPSLTPTALIRILPVHPKLVAYSRSIFVPHVTEQACGHWHEFSEDLQYL
jgi:hypothetical protein